MKNFYWFDPYSSLFGGPPLPRDAVGSALPGSIGVNSVTYLLKELKELFGPKPAVEVWDLAFQGYRSTLGTYCAYLNEASERGLITADDGTVVGEWEQRRGFQVLSVMYQFFLSGRDLAPPEDLPDVEASFAYPFAFACLEEIDDVLMCLSDAGNSAGGAVNAALSAAEALSLANKLARSTPITLATQPKKAEAAAAELLANFRLSGSIGGTLSARTRKKTAVSAKEVYAAAVTLGWPGQTAGVYKRLALKFNRTPERIGQLLRSPKKIQNEGGSF